MALRAVQLGSQFYAAAEIEFTVLARSNRPTVEFLGLTPSGIRIGVVGRPGLLVHLERAGRRLGDPFVRTGSKNLDQDGRNEFILPNVGGSRFYRAVVGGD